MGGLEEILNQIKADANEEAADILAKAQDTCDSIKENAQIEIDKIETAGTKKAESEEKLLFSKIKSAAGMEAKQKYLEAKQKIISTKIIFRVFFSIIKTKTNIKNGGADDKFLKIFFTTILRVLVFFLKKKKYLQFTNIFIISS